MQMLWSLIFGQNSQRSLKCRFQEHYQNIGKFFITRKAFRASLQPQMPSLTKTSPFNTNSIGVSTRSVTSGNNNDQQPTTPATPAPSGINCILISSTFTLCHRKKATESHHQSMRTLDWSLAKENLWARIFHSAYLPCQQPSLPPSQHPYHLCNPDSNQPNQPNPAQPSNHGQVNWRHIGRN